MHRAPVFRIPPAKDVERPFRRYNAPMAFRPPIYQAPGTIWEIDRCRPQREAVEKRKLEWHALSHGHYPAKHLTKTVLPGLSGIGWWDAAERQDWGLEPHRNEGVEIVFQETGENDFIVDGKKHRLRAGNLTVTRPWQLHHLGDPHIGPGRLHWLIIDVGVRRPHQEWRWPGWIILDRRDRKTLTDRLRQNDRPVWPGSSALGKTFLEMTEPVRLAPAKGFASRIAVQVNLLLLELLEMLRKENAKSDPSLASQQRTVLLFLEDLKDHTEGLSHPWTLERMARRCGMGITTFSRCCREITNTSPMQWLNRQRLDHAADLLRREPDRPVTEIAHECGFSTPQYFSTLFRRRHRCSPRAWRHG